MSPAVAFGIILGPKTSVIPLPCTVVLFSVLIYIVWRRQAAKRRSQQNVAAAAQPVMVGIQPAVQDDKPQPVSPLVNLAAAATENEGHTNVKAESPLIIF